MKPSPHGGSLRDELAVYEKAMGRPHPQATPPVEMPLAISYLYRWFHEIATGRPIGGMGALLPIPPSEILAWCTLRQMTLERWELECLRNLDAVFLKVMAEKD